MAEPPILELLGADVAVAVRIEPLAQFSTKLEEIDGRLYGEALDAGVSFVADIGGTIRTVQLHSGEFGQYRRYSGELPQQLRFDYDRATVRRLLGSPTRTGETTVLPVLGEMPPWDHFDHEGVVLHVEYTHDALAIRMVSLMSQSHAP